MQLDIFIIKGHVCTRRGKKAWWCSKILSCVGNIQISPFLVPKSYRMHAKYPTFL